VAQVRRERLLGWVPHVWPAGQTWVLACLFSRAGGGLLAIFRGVRGCSSLSSNFSVADSPSSLHA